MFFIDDEVIIGFGCIGKFFGVDMYGFKFDMMSLVKGLLLVYIFISVVLFMEDIYSVIEEVGNEFGVFGYGFIYMGYLVGCVVVFKNIELMEEWWVMVYVENVVLLF